MGFMNKRFSVLLNRFFSCLQLGSGQTFDDALNYIDYCFYNFIAKYRPNLLLLLDILYLSKGKNKNFKEKK